MSGEELDAALQLYTGKHPGLAEFARSPGSALLNVTVSDLYLADGFK